MAQARVPDMDAVGDLAAQLVEAAIFTGVYRQAAEAYPVTWRKGVELVRAGDCHTGHMLMLTALIGTPDAAQSVFTTIQLQLRGDL